MDPSKHHGPDDEDVDLPALARAYMNDEFEGPAAAAMSKRFRTDPNFRIALVDAFALRGFGRTEEEDGEPNLSCPDTRRALLRYVRMALGPDKSVAMARHMKTCNTCTAYYDGLAHRPFVIHSLRRRFAAQLAVSAILGALAGFLSAVFFW